MNHRESDQEGSEEQLMSLLPDTWRDAASSIMKTRRSGTPQLLPARAGTLGGSSNRSHSLSEPWDVQIPSNFEDSMSSPDHREVTPSLKGASHTQHAARDNAAHRRGHHHGPQRQPLPQEEERWWMSLSGEQSVWTSEGRQDRRKGSYDEHPSVSLGERSSLIRRFNSEHLQWLRRAKVASQKLTPPHHSDPCVTVENSVAAPASFGAIESQQIRVPSGPAQHSDTTAAPELDRVAAQVAGGLDIRRSESPAAELDMGMAEPRMKAQEACGVADASLPDNPTLDLRKNTAPLDLNTVAQGMLEERKAAGEQRKAVDGNVGEIQAAPWDTIFRVISGNNKTKTKRRTLVAPRCHDAYGQLATAFRRQTAARNARHHLLCGAAEGLLCVRMPCITRDCFPTGNSDRFAANFPCGSRECACPLASVPAQDESDTTTHTTAFNRGRRGEGHGRPPSQDLLLRFLQLFKELRWGEAIRARVRQQLTQLQGYLLALQLHMTDASSNHDEQTRVSIEKLLCLNAQLVEARPAANVTATTQGASFATQRISPKILPSFLQAGPEKFLANMDGTESKTGGEQRIPIASLVAVMRERREQAVNELRKAQRIVTSAQEQIEMCRQRHRQNFVEHASHLLNVRSFLNIALRFEDICAISRAQNELFAFAYFLCMSQEGHAVTWPVVEAMAEPKVFFLSWQALLVAFVAFHLLKSPRGPIPSAAAARPGTRRLLGRVLCRSASEDTSPTASQDQNATKIEESAAGTQQADTPEKPDPYGNSFPWFSEEEVLQLLAEELPLAEAGDAMEHLTVLPPRLSSLLFASVERATSICTAHDTGREAETEPITRSAAKALSSTTEAAHIASVIEAAEEARMHNWSLAGCDTLLKLLVATAVQIAKRKELFSADAHASFL